MNKLIVLLLMFACFNAQGQVTNLPLDPSTNLISYTEVVKLTDSTSKDELFSRAKSCFARLFKSSQKVIQNEDKAAGIIIGKGAIKAHARALGSDYDGGFVNFTITIACKDGRYKYTITDFVHEGTGSKMPSGGNLENKSVVTWTNKQWNLMKSQTGDEIKILIYALKLEMNKPSPQNENW